ncbi:phosphoadenosine phosphosulfate reductase family protein [Clostridium sporogenes]|uniref:phosphoadenosine phosphosulfate reductase domain-containing protein n=1 Tax=Clostridium sporogenes TaxID=1509 RepID=UPI0013D6AEDD|nr:phosphoadenosine phosphosulfate reductase family protein [Clostridium sporogenes]NFF75875.1 phospho-adenylylsulfate sulfotransferase [Clostridium sporogenes]NFH40757.1 phospho-adenylylsulfate sulfotransferase [Clostridium sporogenes]
MKPIFEKERLFLEELLNIQIPQNCWRDGSKIYINYDSIFVIRFKVEDGKCYLIKNLIKNIDRDKITIEYKKGNKLIQEEIINLTHEEEYKIKEKEILELEKESIDKTIEYIKRYPDYNIRIGDSTGKDSKLVKYILENKVFPKLNITKKDYVIDFFNSTNEIAETYKNIKQDNNENKLEIHNPSMGWHQWIKVKKKYYIPSTMSRNCCDTFKHGKVKKILDKNKNYITFLGMRKYESAKRADYDWDLNEHMKQLNKLDIPDNWKRFLPIVNWKDEDVWLYVLHNTLNINTSYSYGLNRVGCLLCPYQSNFTDLIIQRFFPSYWDRWVEILKNNYELYNVKKRLKWTLEEWINGRWKQATSKEYEITRLNPTKERIKQLAKIKGVSEDIATKYFNKKCECGKKLNPDEIAMFLKINGRFEDIEDNRIYLCKKCLCEKEGWTGKEYSQLVRRFREQDCSLF